MGGGVRGGVNGGVVLGDGCMLEMRFPIVDHSKAILRQDYSLIRLPSHPESHDSHLGLLDPTLRWWMRHVIKKLNYIICKSSLVNYNVCHCTCSQEIVAKRLANGWMRNSLIWSLIFLWLSGSDLNQKKHTVSEPQLASYQLPLNHSL